jgi:hypothetical protein
MKYQEEKEPSGQIMHSGGEKELPAPTGFIPSYKKVYETSI